MKGHRYPDCKSTEDEAVVLYAQWEGNKQQRDSTQLHTPQTKASLNAAALPCMTMSPSILSAAMALIACCTQPRTLEQLIESEGRGSDTEMARSSENRTGTALQQCARVSGEPMSGDGQDVRRHIRSRSIPPHDRNHRETEDAVKQSTGTGEERAGILSSATENTLSWRGLL